MKYLLILCFLQVCVDVNAQKADDPFHNYDQKIPNSQVSFHMVAIPAGSFVMGSPGTEKGRRQDEGSAIKVFVDSFWIETIQ